MYHSSLEVAEWVSFLLKLAHAINLVELSFVSANCRNSKIELSSVTG